MSHYAVAVIHRDNQDIDELLAPFDENLKVEPYLKYTRQQAIDYVRKNWLRDGEEKSDDECWQMMAEDYQLDGVGCVNKAGNIYSTYNPDSKWDWYVEGGRFCGSIPTLRGDADEAYIDEILLSSDEEVYKKALRFWDVVVNGAEPESDEERYHSIYSATYFKEYYGDAETYARRTADFSTYAVITPDGEWHGKGEMGWWGCSSETASEAADWDAHYIERFITPYRGDDTMMMTIVDCHI